MQENQTQEGKFIEDYENNESTQNVSNDLINYTANSAVIEQMMNFFNDKNHEQKVSIDSNEPSSVIEEPNGSTCLLKTSGPNMHIIAWARRIGGRWNGDKGAWEFNTIVKDQALEMSKILNSEPLIVEVTAIKDLLLDYKPFYFMGYSMFFIPKENNGKQKLNINKDFHFITISKPKLIQNEGKDMISIPKHSAFRIRVPNMLFDRVMATVNPYELHINIIKQ